MHCSRALRQATDRIQFGGLPVVSAMIGAVNSGELDWRWLLICRLLSLDHFPATRRATRPLFRRRSGWAGQSVRTGLESWP